MLRRHLLGLTSFALLSPLVVGACSKNTQATPRVTFTSQISPGSHVMDDPNGASACKQSGVWLNIGDFGNPGAGTDGGMAVQPVVPVDDGGSFNGGTASVTCSVTAEGDGFHLSATAVLSGSQGGEFFVDGHFTAQGDQPNIHASWTSQVNNATYISDGKSFSTLCIARYDQPLMTTSAGRAWASIDCPDASDRNGSQRVCHLQGQFRFENCNQ
jgi:hypothetical protein